MQEAFAVKVTTATPNPFRFRTTERANEKASRELKTNRPVPLSTEERDLEECNFRFKAEPLPSRTSRRPNTGRRSSNRTDQQLVNPVARVRHPSTYDTGLSMRRAVAVAEEALPSTGKPATAQGKHALSTLSKRAQCILEHSARPSKIPRLSSSAKNENKRSFTLADKCSTLPPSRIPLWRHQNGFVFQEVRSLTIEV